MNNMELIEYLKVCGVDILENESIKDYDCVLNSSISIKRYIDVCRRLEIPNDYIRHLIREVYKLFEDENLKEAINILNETLTLYNKYLRKIDVTQTLASISVLLNIGAFGYNDIERLKELKWLRRNHKILITENGVSNLYTVYRKTYEGGIEVFDLVDVSSSKMIVDVGAVIIKDSKYEILRVQNESDIDKIDKRLRQFDYDLAVIPKS